MRSRLGRRTARLAHAAAHDGHGQTGCHVVQPGSRRSSQRSDCQRDRRIRRPNGPYHRPHDHSVPDAQPVEGCGNVEPPGAMRQNPFFGGVASHARKHLEPLYLAGRRDRTAVRPGSGNKRGAVGQSARRNHNVVQFRARHDFFGSRIGCGFRSDTPKCTVGRRKTRHPGRSDPHGRRIFLPESHTHLRHIPRRSDALRSLARRGRQGGGRRFARHYGESPGHRFRDRTHEDRNPGAPRRPDHRFRNPRTTIRRRKPAKFSFSPETKPIKEQLPCFLVYTSKEVHDILRTGFDRSPLFNGTICGIGPRYCPSIEDKLRTFADKDQHQLFLEPEGSSTNEYYLNGFSSSLPWEVQWKALHKIRGFEDLHIFRPGYAIEYDYFPPTQLHHSLETKLVSGLYFAGRSTVRQDMRKRRRRA